MSVFSLLSLTLLFERPAIDFFSKFKSPPAVKHVSILIRHPKAVIKQSWCIDSSLLVLPMIWEKQTLALWIFSQHSIQTAYMSISSTLYVWHTNGNHSPCKWVCGTSFILTGTLAWLIACLCWREVCRDTGAATYSFIVKKVC